jgi:hypothetical protein
MKAIKLAAALVCVCLLVLSACAPAPETPGKDQDGALAPVAPDSALSIRPSDEGVGDFLALLGDGAPKAYENDACFNITPDYIKDHSDFLIFKFDQSCASFLENGGKAYPLGEFLGGTGADSFALADLTGDGVYELYFTFSWGSGMHRSQVGYFDPKTKAVTIFDAAFYSEDCMLTLDENGNLQISHADILYGMDELSFYVSFDLTAGEPLGAFSYENGAVQFVQADENPA